MIGALSTPDTHHPQLPCAACGPNHPHSPGHTNTESRNGSKEEPIFQILRRACAGHATAPPHRDPCNAQRHDTLFCIIEQSLLRQTPPPPVETPLLEEYLSPPHLSQAKRANAQEATPGNAHCASRDPRLVAPPLRLCLEASYHPLFWDLSLS